MNAVIENIKRYPLVFISVAVILICLVLIVMRGDVVATLEQTEGDLYGRVRVIEKNKINANGLKAELEQVRAKVATIDERLFDPNKSSLNANFFYSLEEQVDILITQVNLVESQDPMLSKGGSYELKQYGALTYNLMIEGTFTEIIRFMHKLHVAKPLIRIADFQIQEGAQSAIPGALKTNIRLLVLARKE
ncbi:MAG: hypothetical protein ACN4GF_07360 [Lentimonas sp.]